PTVSVSAPSTQFPNGQVLLDGNLYDAGNSIRICPVTAGRLAAPGYLLQRDIARATCGGQEAHIKDTDQTLAAADLETFFVQSLATILPTDKLEVVADTQGTVIQGATKEERFLGSANDGRTTIILSWNGSSDRDRFLPFELWAPNGTTKVNLTGR